MTGFLALCVMVKAEMGNSEIAIYSTTGRRARLIVQFRQPTSIVADFFVSLEMPSIFQFLAEVNDREIDVIVEV